MVDNLLAFVSQSEQKIGKKSPKFWGKSSQNSHQTKKAKISSSKLNLKVQNINITHF
jgi:hypothetical protein